MVDLASLGDSAIAAFVQLNPSAPWAIKVAENWKGLPFGKYLHASNVRRRRALTGPVAVAQPSTWPNLHLFSSGEPLQSAYNDQANSLLFAKLPLDIRIIIYDFLLAGSLLHIHSQHQAGRIYHTVCARPQTVNEVDHQCQDFNPNPLSNSSDPRDPSLTIRAFPLLLSCRRIYSEAISTLYKGNVFDFTSNNVAFRFLKTMLPPQRLHCIRHFRMTMRLPHHPTTNSRSLRDWQSLFDFFRCEMRGLKTLFLKLLMLHPCQQQIRDTPDEQCVAWVKPMLAMAAEASLVRGCEVQIATGQIVQHLGQIIRDFKDKEDDSEEAMRQACIFVHNRIRISLGGLP